MARCTSVVPAACKLQLSCNRHMVTGAATPPHQYMWIDYSVRLPRTPCSLLLLDLFNMHGTPIQAREEATIIDWRPGKCLLVAAPAPPAAAAGKKGAGAGGKGGKQQQQQQQQVGRGEGRVE